MGLFDRFTNGDDEDEEDDEPVIDHYAVCHSSPRTNGGWEVVDEFGDLDEPIDFETFEFNYPGTLEGGRYRLFAVDTKGIRRSPSDGFDWKEKIEGDMPQPRDTDPARAAEEAARRAVEEAQDQGPEIEDPDRLEEVQRAKLRGMALSNPEFAARYEEHIANWMFDTSADEEEVGVEDWDERPLAATLAKATDDPETFGALGENLGTAAGSFMDGFYAGGPVGDDSEELDEEEDEDAPFEPDESVDAGASGFDELGSAFDNDPDKIARDVEELAEKTADARTRREDRSRERRDAPPRREDAPRAETGADEPMSAAPGDAKREPGDSDQDGEDAPTEGEIASESEVQASPEVVERAAGNGETPQNPDQCQFIKDDGDQCGNRADDGSAYCWIDSHGPPDRDRGESPGTDTTPDVSTEPSEQAEEVADKL